MTRAEPTSPDLAQLMRRQMGRAFGRFDARPGTCVVLEPTWWVAFLGRPAPDLNVALVHEDDPAALAAVLGHVRDAQVGALVMLAGGGTALAPAFPEGWDAAGSMPMMACDLDATPAEDDARVRAAGPADAATVTALAAEAFGMDPDDVEVMVELAVQPGSGVVAWLLEADGEAVSTVLTVRDEDSVLVFTMATPERLARRGYGGALLGAVLARARADGARIGLLGATPAGYPLYEARGWRTVEEWQILTNAASEQFH